MAERYRPLHRFSDSRDDIWIAEDIDTGSVAVLKHTDSEHDPSFVAKNYQSNLEAHSLRELSKRNPLRIVNFKSFYRHDESRVVLAMEKAQCSLADAYLVRQKLTESEAKVVIQCTLEALVTCHSKYIVHRDVSPKNLFLFSDDLNSLKLGGFGVSAKDDLFSSGTGFKGTKGYMAPEQMRVRNYGRPVDIWATGVQHTNCCTLVCLFRGGQQFWIRRNRTCNFHPPSISRKKIRHFFFKFKYYQYLWTRFYIQ
ncbi:kinase-like domain-containing protein [Chytriomyces cf. hyalinus JEL632]|nr:kinase-like domain-containing protein [Chytriomyces cf. hyalinus JEL632]